MNKIEYKGYEYLLKPSFGYETPSIEIYLNGNLFHTIEVKTDITTTWAEYVAKKTINEILGV